MLRRDRAEHHATRRRTLRRMAARIREIGLKTRRVPLDRAFFNGAVVAFLQEEKLPFVTSVVIRGRKPKKGAKPSGFRWIKRRSAGWHPHVMKHEKQTLKISVCAGYPRRRPQGRQEAASEVIVRGVARARLPDRNPQTAPSAIWHRDQFSPNVAGENLHLHSESSAAVVFSCRGIDSSESLGMDSSHLPCQRGWRQTDATFETITIQTDARMDRTRNRFPISRRLSALRHSAAVIQTY